MCSNFSKLIVKIVTCKMVGFEYHENSGIFYLREMSRVPVGWGHVGVSFLRLRLSSCIYYKEKDTVPSSRAFGG